MRLYNSYSGRPAYYDRTPTMVGQVYSQAAVAPLAQTNQWTYTVPSARKAYMDFALASLIQNVASAPAGKAGAFIRVNHVDTPTVSPFAAYAVKNAAAVGSSDRSQVGGTVMCKAGDIIKAFNFDLSTGGSIDYEIDASFTEFDA